MFTIGMKNLDARTNDVIPNHSLNPKQKEVFAIGAKNMDSPTLEIYLKSDDSADVGDGFLSMLSF